MVKLRNYESKETEFGVKTYAEDLRLPLPHMYNIEGKRLTALTKRLLESSNINYYGC